VLVLHHLQFTYLITHNFIFFVVYNLGGVVLFTVVVIHFVEFQYKSKIILLFKRLQALEFVLLFMLSDAVNTLRYFECWKVRLLTRPFVACTFEVSLKYDGMTGQTAVKL